MVWGYPRHYNLVPESALKHFIASIASQDWKRVSQFLRKEVTEEEAKAMLRKALNVREGKITLLYWRFGAAYHGEHDGASLLSLPMWFSVSQGSLKRYYLLRTWWRIRFLDEEGLPKIEVACPPQPVICPACGKEIGKEWCFAPYPALGGMKGQIYDCLTCLARYHFPRFGIPWFMLATDKGRKESLVFEDESTLVIFPNPGEEFCNPQVWVFSQRWKAKKIASSLKKARIMTWEEFIPYILGWEGKPPHKEGSS